MELVSLEIQKTTEKSGEECEVKIPKVLADFMIHDFPDLYVV